MVKDKKDAPKTTGKQVVSTKRGGRAKKTPEEHSVELPSLSLPSTSQEVARIIDKDELHDRLMDCRSMARPVKANLVRNVSSDEESVYTSHTLKRRRVKVGREHEQVDSDYTPRSPSPRMDPGLGDASTIAEFKTWLSEEFLKLRGTLDHILSEVSRVGKRLTDVEDSHRIEKTRIRSLQEKALTQTGQPPQNTTVPMAAPPSASQTTKPSKNPWGCGKGVL